MFNISLQRTVSLAILAGIIGMTVFGGVFVEQSMREGHCIASSVTGDPCATNPISTVQHHLSAIQTFLSSLAPSFSTMGMLIAFAALLLLSTRVRPPEGLRATVLRPRHVSSPPNRDQAIHWLALHENSPSVGYERLKGGCFLSARERHAVSATSLTSILTHMKSPTITLSLVLLIFAGLFFWGSSGRGGTGTSLPGASAGRAAASVLTASEPFYDFGTISMKDGNVTREFVVTNPTDREVTVAAIVTSCMCTEAFLVQPNGRMKGPFGMEGMGYIPPANEPIQAGESRVLRVVYDPNAHGPAGVGRISRLVKLTDTLDGTLQLEIVANVTP